MKTVSIEIARSVDACWEVFVDAAKLTSWVPGLREARVVSRRGDGLPHEIEFAYAGGLTYGLIYSYSVDLDERTVRWEPREGQTGGLRGFAQFVTTEQGTDFTYSMEHDGGRKAAERALDDPNYLLAAFARRMHEDLD